MTNTVTEEKYSRYYHRDMSLFGAFPRSDLLRFRLRVPRAMGAVSVRFCCHADALDYPDAEEKVFSLHWEGMEQGEDIYAFSLPLHTLTGSLLYYRYVITGEQGETCFGGEEPKMLLPCDRAGDRQLLLFDDDFETPAPMKEGIIYHIFVDRFRKSGRCEPRRDAVMNPDWDNGIPQFGPYPGAKFKNNMFFGGDLYGVAEKLDYIASLGTKTVYLSPVFEAASNHKYDTADYLNVDAMFGGEEALTALIKKAEEKGIRVILDGVFNHTGSDSLYFNREGHYGEGGAYRSKESPYYPWYTFRTYPDDYECWWGVDILPRVNSADPSYRQFMFEQVIPKWMALGVGGWRLDVADELSCEFLQDLRQTVKQHDPDAPIIGEVWEDATNKIAYGRRRPYMQGKQLDSVMNYPLRGAVIGFIRNGDYETLRQVTGGQYRRYPKQVSDAMMNFLGTHDTERILTVLGGEETGEHTNAELSVLRMNAHEKKHAKALLKIAYALIAALPGVPCVFYGDEVGMEGYRDPFCRRPFPWNAMDENLLSFYRQVGRMRQTEPLLMDGGFENAFASPELYGFFRTPWHNEPYRLLVVINRSDRAVPLRLPQEGTDLLGGETGSEITLAPLSAAYIRLPL